MRPLARIIFLSTTLATAALVAAATGGELIGGDGEGRIASGRAGGLRHAERLHAAPGGRCPARRAYGGGAAARGRERRSGRTPLRAVSVKGGVATIDLGEKFAAGTNTASLSARVTQLVLTATSISGVKSVRLLVKGATRSGLFPGYVTSRPISAKFARAPDVPPPGEPAPEPTTDPTAAARDLQQRLADLSLPTARRRRRQRPASRRDSP